MNRLGIIFFALFFSILYTGSPTQAAKVGAPAPAFTAKDSLGKTHKLSEMKGHFVVLEWHNQGCPYVVSQYKGKMEGLQAKWTKKGVLWFSVISSVAGKQGHVDAAQANQDVKEHQAHPTATFMDTDTVIARAYGAKTTPHMFVINPRGS